MEQADPQGHHPDRQQERGQMDQVDEPVGSFRLGDSTDRKNPSETRIGATSRLTRTSDFRPADSGVWST
jgi:hypothetical protein